jgi:hypothetical protein
LIIKQFLFQSISSATAAHCAQVLLTIDVSVKHAEEPVREICKQDSVRVVDVLSHGRIL